MVWYQKNERSVVFPLGSDLGIDATPLYVSLSFTSLNSCGNQTPFEVEEIL